ncbi:hypothetical protein ACFST9_13905 [Hymenobacter monticola]|uniref:Conjugal transfer protein n=2 Tax=Hymenobacter TaxID=89966 RepID=A0ABU3TLS2_9BACT|nr:hypothetical protein [Hymenobacter endophyticus]MDU0372282.1 hypothetical protein [Hymenobacter endophyticus]
MKPMLWLVLFLLLVALGGLWWRYAMPAGTGSALAPPALDGNHASLRTRHYRLADFQDAPPQAPTATAAAADVTGAEAEAAPADAPTETAASIADGSQAEDQTPTATAEAGQLPEGAKHNYITAPAPTATDAHNRGVELTAAERRAKMRLVMNEALENQRAAPATA